MLVRASSVKTFRLHAILLLVGGLSVGCASVKEVGSSQPANLGQLKTQVKLYVNQDYQRELTERAEEASVYIQSRAHHVARPAIVLDIDETSLSSLPEILANDFGYIVAGPCNTLPKGPCGADAWIQMAIADPIRPVLELYKTAVNEGVAVFFVTGRPAAQQADTEANLKRAGYATWSGLYLRPSGTFHSAADFKAPARKAIAEAGYTIIANIGDQSSDLAGGYAEQTFQMPNPFYYLP